MAGVNPYLPGSDGLFREKIRLVQRMGLPEDVSLRPVFRFKDPTFWAHTDEKQVPWDLMATPDPASPPVPASVTAGDDDGQVLVSVVERESNADTKATAIADFGPMRHALLFLDEEWEKVDGFETVTIGSDVYRYEYMLPPRGLFGVTVHRAIVGTAERR